MTSNTDYIAGVVAEAHAQYGAFAFSERIDTNGYKALKAFIESKLLEAQAFALREVMPEEDYDGWNDCLSQLKRNALNKLNITL